MLKLNFELSSSTPAILCLGAHADDIEIGCGATLLHLTKMYPQAKIYWMVFTAAGEREQEARASAASYLRDVSESHVEIAGFRDGFLPYEGEAVKSAFEHLKARFSPDLIFTHYRDDRHQDHRLVSDLTWNTFRNHLILEYEVPKFDGDLGQPNVFQQLAPEVGKQKIDLLMQHFASQRSKTWFTDDLFHGLMRIRGMECQSGSGLAEAFYARKICLGESALNASR